MKSSSPQNTASADINKALDYTVARSQNLTRTQIIDTIDTLRNYECWDPLKSWLRKLIQTQPNSFEFEIELARATWDHRHSVRDLAKEVGAIVESHNLSFAEYELRVKRRILRDKDWANQAALLENIFDKFKAQEQKIKALEKTALIYEKKWLNEEKLYKAYSNLLKKNANNVKALKYFKVLAIQMQDWKTGIGYLHRLLRAVNGPTEKIRIAQEAAAIALYQLNLADESLNILDQYCSDSYLDTSTIRYDANMRLGRLDACIMILNEVFKDDLETNEKAIIYFKLGTLEDKRNNKREALRYFSLSFEHGRLAEAAERICQIAVSSQDWPSLQHGLSLFHDLDINDGLRKRIKETQNRLKSLAS
jgi:hypothetical protein